MTIRHFGAEDPVDTMLAELRETGVIVIDRLIDAAVMDALMTELAPHLDDAPVGGGEFFGGAMKRVQEVAARAPSIATIIADPTLVALGDAVLLDNCESYRIQVLAILEIHKGGRNQPLHRDVRVYEPYIMREPGGKEMLLSWIVAGTDFTAANGATRVVPGSHTWPREWVANDDEWEIVDMSRGSTPPMYRAPASSRAMPSAGCVRRRTSTSPARPRMPPNCPNGPSKSSATASLRHPGPLQRPRHRLAPGPAKTRPRRQGLQEPGPAGRVRATADLQTHRFRLELRRLFLTR